MMSQPQHASSRLSRVRDQSWVSASYLTIALLSLLATSDAQIIAAAPPSITSQASASLVQVAEPFTVEWTVVAPIGAKVTFPEIGAQLGNFDVMESSDQFDIPQAGISEQRRWTRRMTLETIFAGEQQIPEFEIQVRTDLEATSADVMRTQPLTIQVASVLEDRADPTQFRDIESVVDVEVLSESSQAWMWWTFGTAGAISLLAAASVLVARRRSRMTPENWALDELTDVNSSLNAGQADADAAAFRTSDILRDFLILQLGIPDSGHTPHELVHEIELQHLVAGETSPRLNSLFTLADDAKFGGLQLTNTDVANAITEAREIVLTIASSQRR